MEAAFKALSEPAAMEALLKGFQTAPDLSLRLLSNQREGFLEMQRRWTEAPEKTRRAGRALQFQRPGQRVFKPLDGHLQEGNSRSFSRFRSWG